MFNRSHTLYSGQRYCNPIEEAGKISVNHICMETVNVAWGANSIEMWESDGKSAPWEPLRHYTTYLQHFFYIARSKAMLWDSTTTIGKQSPHKNTTERETKRERERDVRQEKTQNRQQSHHQRDVSVLTQQTGGGSNQSI